MWFLICSLCLRILFNCQSWVLSSAKGYTGWHSAQGITKEKKTKNFPKINFVSLFATFSFHFLNRGLITGTKSRRREYKLSDFFLRFDFVWLLFLEQVETLCLPFEPNRCRYIHSSRSRVHRCCCCLRFDVIYAFNRKTNAKKKKRILCGLSVHSARRNADWITTNGFSSDLSNSSVVWCPSR